MGIHTIHAINPEKLRTGNIKLDEKIGYLLGVIHGDIGNLLNQDGNISCANVNQSITKNTYKLPPEVLSECEKIIKKVRKSLMLLSEISSQIDEESSLNEAKNIIKSYNKEAIIDRYILIKILKKAENISEAKELMKKYGKGIEINNIILNTLLNKCIHLAEIDEIIGEYVEGINPTGITFIILLKTTINDSNISNEEKKFYLRQLFSSLELNNIELSEENKRAIGSICVSSKTFYNFIKTTIKKDKITKLNFLLSETKISQ